MKVFDRFIKQYQSSSKIKELLQGTFWTALGMLISKGTIFIAWIMIGRILGKEDYGTFGIIRNTAVMFASFAGLGLGITASKFVAEFINSNKTKAESILGLTLTFGCAMGIIVGISVYMLSPIISDKMLHSKDLVTDLRIASLILFFNSLNGAQMGALQGLQAFKTIATINTRQSLWSFPVFIIGAYYGNVRGSIWAFTFYSFIICLLSHMALKKEMKIKNLTINLNKSLKSISIITSYSLPAFLSGLMVTPLRWLGDVLLVNTPKGFEKMGIFTAALTFNVIFMMAISMFDAPFLTILSKNKTESINSKFNRVNIIGPWIIGTFIIIPFLIFPEIGIILFGNSYNSEDFKWTFIIVSLFTLIIMYKQGLSRILAVYNLQWYGFSSNLVWGGFLLLTFYHIQKLGSVGLSIAYLVGYIASALFLLPIYYQKNLIPKNTIFSKYALLLWCLIITATMLNFIDINIYIFV